MNQKQLIPLAVVLLVLLAVGVTIKRQRPVESLEEQVKLSTLLPASLATDAVTKIELGQGKNEPSVQLAKDGAEWTIASAFGAWAKKDKLDEFLKKLKDMEGEYKSSNADAFADYGVNDDKALYVRLYTGGEKPAYELLIGKGQGWDSVFVRTAGDKTVYLVNQGLRGDLGLYGEDVKAPEYKPWLKIKALELAKDKVAKIELKYPDHALTFEKREKPKPEAKKEEKPADAKTEPKKDEKKEYEWVLALGGPAKDAKFKQPKLDSLLETLENLTIDDALGPKEKTAKGLDTPPYRCTVTLEDGKKHEVFLSHPRDDSLAYLYLGDAPERLYTYASFRFDNLFPAGSDLFDLTAPRADKAKVTAVSVAREKETIQLAKTGEGDKAEWLLKSPVTGFGLQKAKVEDLLSALGGWTAKDYTDPEGLVKYGLSLPRATLTAQLGDQAFSLLLGAEHPALKQSYVAPGKDAPVLTMADDEVKKAFPALADLLDLSGALAVKADDVSAVTVKAAGQPELVLKREKTKIKEGDQEKEVEKWSLASGGQEVEVDSGKALAYLRRLESLAATGLYAGDAAVFTGDKVESVNLTTASGLTALELGAEEAAGRPARISTRAATVVLDKAAAKGLLPTVDELKLVKPQPAASKTVANPFENKDAKPAAPAEGAAAAPAVPAAPIEAQPAPAAPTLKPAAEPAPLIKLEEAGIKKPDTPPAPTAEPTKP